MPTSANLRGQDTSFADLAAACGEWCDHINARAHRETGVPPVQRLAVERAQLRVLPADPRTAALGEERLVNDDQTVRFGSVRYSTPPGHVGSRVWCRIVGDELAIVAMTPGGAAWCRWNRTVADLLPAARAARVALGAKRRALSRDTLADRMRDDGHGVSNARASLLLKILEAEDTVTPLDDSAPGCDGCQRPWRTTGRGP